MEFFILITVKSTLANSKMEICMDMVFCTNSKKNIEGKWAHGKYVKPQHEGLKMNGEGDDENSDLSPEGYKI